MLYNCGTVKNLVVFGSSGNGSCPVHGLHRAWGNSSSYQHPSSSPMIWPNSPSFSNGVHAQRPTQVPGFPRPPPHMLNTTPPMHHHHVGSAPAVNPSLWDRRQAYGGESPETSGFHLGSLGSSVGFPGSSLLHPLEMASHIFPRVGGNCMDLSANVGLRSPQQICHLFPGRNTMLSIPSSFDLPVERVRNLSHRRTEANSNHTDKKQYELDIDRILRGEDSRTTLMIKNIPNKYVTDCPCCFDLFSFSNIPSRFYVALSSWFSILLQFSIPKQSIYNMHCTLVSIFLFIFTHGFPMYNC